MPGWPTTPLQGPLHTYSRLVDEPCGGLVRHRRALGHPPRSLYLRQGPERQDPGLHRRLKLPLPPLHLDENRRGSPRES